MSSVVQQAEGEEGQQKQMKGPADLIEGYRRFRLSTYKRYVQSYRELGAHQEPNVMLIGCADSRVDPSSIFDAGPGQLFVVRNVANLCPPYNPDGNLHGVSAALEYAVNVLKVGHIVVMGHGGCGGVAAALAGEVDPSVAEFVGPWVGILKDACDKVKASNSFNPQNALELEGIESSLINLMSFPFVRARVEEGSLELHGAWFAIHHGELHWRNKLTRRFEVVPMLCYDSLMPSSKISLKAPAAPAGGAMGKTSLPSPQLVPSKALSEGAVELDAGVMELPGPAAGGATGSHAGASVKARPFDSVL